jgi:membrane protease YdiL (CAAX protease family)
MFSAAVFICWVTGSLKLKDEFLSGGAGIIIIYFFGFFFQGMYEEVIFRGYFMTEIAAKKTIPLAIITNSVIFAVFHGMNPGVSVLAIINLVLFGVFASIFFLKSDSIWGICAIHSIWNFVQGNFYGIKVSGIDGINSVFRFESVSGKELINGGNFGLEGGLGVTIVLTAGVIIMLLIKGKCSELAASENETNPEIQ